MHPSELHATPAPQSEFAPQVSRLPATHRVWPGVQTAQ
jgi:hypothetical protein